MKINSKASWVECGGKRYYARSKAERQYGLYLQWLKDHGAIVEFWHEPETFWFEGIRRGVTSYKPDFKILEKDGTHWWAEVKGFMDAKSKTKIKRFAKYYPKETLRVIDSKWIAKNINKIL